MLSDPELSALLAQAARNLDTLETLVRSTGDDDVAAVVRLRERLEELKRAYKSETDALTRVVLERAVERRATKDRRRGSEMQTTS
jgi:hypothetical protein